MYLENLLGTVALAVNDRMQECIAAESGVGAQGPAALVLISQRPGQSIRRLADRLRLSHSATVRLVETLSFQGLIERDNDDDRRVVRLSVSRKGKKLLDRLQHARLQRLEVLVSSLNASQRNHLMHAFESILANATETFTDAYANCRLCDVPLCEAVGCPVEAKAHSIWANRKDHAAAQGDLR